MAVGLVVTMVKFAARVLPSRLQKIGYIAASLSGASLGVKRSRD